MRLTIGIVTGFVAFFATAGFLAWVGSVIGQAIRHGHDNEPEFEISPYAHCDHHDQFDWARAESDFRAPYDHQKDGL